MSNLLSPGAGGLVAPSPKDAQAVPPNQVGLPAPGPSQMQGHFTSAEDIATAQYQKVKEAKEKMDATLKEFEKLTAFNDTITMDDLVEAAGNMVAAGIPTIPITSLLADAPAQPSQLQGWVQEQIQKIIPKAQQLDQQYANAGYGLAQTSMMSLVGHSAEEHYNRKRLAAMPVAGSA